MHFLTIKIKSKKVSRNIVDISTIKITSTKVRRSKVDFSTIEITSKKVRGNNVDFWTIKITSKKVHGNYVDFSISEITSKKYVELTWKFVEIWSWRIGVISTWNGRGFDVECSLGYHYISKLLLRRPCSYFVYFNPSKQVLNTWYKADNLLHLKNLWKKS